MPLRTTSSWLLVLALASLLGSPNTLPAATWYLSPTGDDSTGDGSLAKPWYELEVVMARSEIHSGDQVILLDGLYDYGSDKQSITRSFDPLNPVIIRAANHLGATIQGAGDPPGGNSDAEGVGIHGASGIVLDGLEIRHSGDNALHIGVDCSYITVRNCKIHDAGSDGDSIKINGSHHITIENCTVFDPGRRRGSQSWTWQENIDFYDCTDCLVRYCLLYHTDRGGDAMLYAKGNSFRITFEANVLTDQYSGAFFPPITLGGTNHSQPSQMIDDGVIGDDGPPPDPDPNTYAATDIVFRNNLVIRATHGSVAFTACNNGWVVNNVFYDCAGGGVWFLSQDNTVRTSRDCHVHNNIFLDPDGDMQGLYRRGLTADNQPMVVYSFTASHNLFYNAALPIPSTGFLDANLEPAAILADPRLVSPTAGGTDLPTIAHNYWLRPTSPAIDAGLDTTAQPYPAVTTDFDALPRPIGPQLDIGMFEATTAGDIDHDADVDLDDFDLLASGLSGPAAPTAIPAADLNDDGHCDLADFAILAANFTAQP